MFVGGGQSDGIYAEYLYLLHIRMGAPKRKVFGGRSGLVIKRGARNRTDPRRTQQIILSSQLEIRSLNHVTKGHLSGGQSHGQQRRRKCELYIKGLELA